MNRSLFLIASAYHIEMLRVANRAIRGSSCLVPRRLFSTTSSAHVDATIASGQDAPTDKSSNSKGLNKFSSRITQPKSQGASQAMLYATGLTEPDMDKAQVGISSVWFEG